MVVAVVVAVVEVAVVEVAEAAARRVAIEARQAHASRHQRKGKEGCQNIRKSNYN